MWVLIILAALCISMNKKTIRIHGEQIEKEWACPLCGSSDIIGHGRQHNSDHPRRFKCGDCGKTFNEKIGTIFYHKKMPRDTIITIVYLFLTGYPASNMPPLVQVTEKSIRNLLREVVERFEKYEEFISAPDDYAPKVIEIDEIYIKIQGSREFYGWLAYDPENKYLIDFVVGKRDDETLEELFKELEGYKGRVELVLIDAYRGYEKFVEKYLADGMEKPLTGVINKSEYSETEGFVTYALFGGKRESVEAKISYLGLGEKITTALIECLNSQIRDLCNYMRRRSKRIPRLLSWGEKAISCFKFMHNYLKAHLTLSGKSSKNWITVPVTPCMKAGICDHQIGLIEILNFRF